MRDISPLIPAPPARPRPLPRRALQLKRRVVPRVFSSVLGFQPNPRAPLPASPALTHTSMPLWALQEVSGVVVSLRNVAWDM